MVELSELSRVVQSDPAEVLEDVTLPAMPYCCVVDVTMLADAKIVNPLVVLEKVSVPALVPKEVTVEPVVEPVVPVAFVVFPIESV
jgi:hypothetical protein